MLYYFHRSVLFKVIPGCYSELLATVATNFISEANCGSCCHMPM